MNKKVRRKSDLETLKRLPNLTTKELLEYKRQIDISDFENCHNWTGRKDWNYGKFKIAGNDYFAHRIMYKITYNDPGDLLVCHSCDNPSCCNPKHLFLGINQDNMTDMKLKRRTRIKRIYFDSPLSVEEESLLDNICSELQNLNNRGSI